MNKKHVIMLVLLGAIWGASFMFMRILSPVLGPVYTASFRLLIGGVVLLSFYFFRKEKVNILGEWKLFLLLGAVSLAIPYFLFALAALYIPSGLSAVLNSTTPMFSFMLSIILFSERISVVKIIGLVLGTTGVFIISSQAVLVDSRSSVIGISACVLAALMYAVAGVIVKRSAKHIDSKSLAVGNQLFAGVLLLPFAIFYPVAGVIDLNIVLILILFGSFGSGVASLLYFTLMKEVGPLKTFTVTYLLPIFGVFWGYVILNEMLTLSFFLGGLFIVLGTVLVTKNFQRKKAA